ncbi:MAG TPA: methylenetetrahydrofolate reductase [Stellaceae bacterium]|nr:methylenetetrahydrofolate reductase [Stellaceae bacterium]
MNEPLQTAIVALVQGASLELMPRDKAAVDRAIEKAAPGSEVYIARVPGDAHGATVATAVLLRNAGFEPIPHVGARYFESKAALDDTVARLVGEAGVDKVLSIAGDLDRAEGPFESSTDVIATGVFARHNIKRVGIAGYPEGHNKIELPVLAEHMAKKLDLLAQQNIAPLIVSQFCFEAGPIADFIARVRARGVTAPIRIGLAGPASITTLTRFAIRCGIGNSLRALTSGRGITRLLSEAGPEAVVAALAPARLGAEGLHIYTFGGVSKAADWLNAVRAGKFDLTDDGAGFRIRR